MTDIKDVSLKEVVSMDTDDTLFRLHLYESRLLVCFQGGKYHEDSTQYSGDEWFAPVDR